MRRVPFAITLGFVLACSTAPRPGDVVPRFGDEISVCGQLFHTGTRVVLWNDPGGYDAYRVEPRFPDEMTDTERAAYASAANYGSLRRNFSAAEQSAIADDGIDLDMLRRHVDQFVIHFDVCGTSRQCFKVLHDQRRLSVHFLLDSDGTIYQTLDLKERAWHAAEANDRSVGVEIAHIGCYPSPKDKMLRTWYGTDAQGVRVTFPDSLGDPGIRTPDFIPRPARPDLIAGTIQGKRYWQYDFTNEQYAALARLAATLHRVLPAIVLDAPRGKDGRVLARALNDREFAAWHGLLGHYHVTDNKIDPGPAFDWDRVLADARAFAE